jgi:hypothetical protein
MSRFQFECQVSVDRETGKPEVVYFQFRGGEVARTREVLPGRALLDLDGRGKPLGLEVLAPVPLEALRGAARRWPAPLADFVFALLPPAFVQAKAGSAKLDKGGSANGPGLSTSTEAGKTKGARLKSRKPAGEPKR